MTFASRCGSMADRRPATSTPTAKTLAASPMDDNPATPKARLSSQLEPHVANPEWPNWGRDALDHGHAIFAIAAHLRTLGLEHWFARLTKWLSNYDGFEHYVEDGHDPCVSVRDLLASYVTRWRMLQLSPPVVERPSVPCELLSCVINDILKLDFLYYRAYWGKGLYHDEDARAWNPLKQSWMSFVESGRPNETLFSWRAFLPPKPTLEQHRLVLNGGSS